MPREAIQVSVLMPMKNAEAYVASALASILEEKDVNLEVVVIDDASTDASRERVLALRDERIRIFPGAGAGIAASMNAGLSHARGQILMRCDADDLFPRGRVKRQALWLLGHPEYVAVCGSFSTMDNRARLVADLVEGCGEAECDVDQELLDSALRTHLCTFAFRADAARRAGGFRDFFVTGEDLDFQFRLAEQGRIRYVPENEYFYRLHGASITHNQPNDRRDFFERSARAFCQQRRELGSDDLQRGNPPSPPAAEAAQPHVAAAHVQGMLLGAAWGHLARGNRTKAIVLGWRSVATNLFSFGTCKSFVALLLKAATRRASAD